MATTPPSTPLPTTDSAATLADTTVNQLASIAIQTSEAAVIVMYPWLGWAVFKQLWEIPFNYFIGQLSSALGTLTGYVVIDIQKYFALKKAASALAALNTAKASGDQNAITQASADVDAAVAPILHYVGSVGSG
jgi:hypothetical protein